MAHRIHQSKRILIVGGGVSGLSIATRLAQAGFPVIVLEASQLGFGASTRNQGWLHSGAWFAREQPRLARMCYESFQQTLRYCPECLEPESGSMTYLMAEPETDPHPWTSAWDAVGLPYEELAPQTLFERFPGIAISQAQRAYQLPDRAMRPEILLRSLAETAEQSGADLCAGTTVARLLYRDQEVVGVETAAGEKIPARLVILASNAKGGGLFPEFGTGAVGSERDLALVPLKTHLVAVHPEVSQWPLCVVDAEGFNHIPHRSTSIFGSNRWLPIHDAEDEQSLPGEIEHLWNDVGRFFPDFRRDDHTTLSWAGTTIQAVSVDEIEPVGTPWPMVVDHERERPAVKNLLSVFPGRASLWAHLAEQTQQVVLEKLEASETKIAAPPWGSLTIPTPVGCDVATAGSHANAAGFSENPFLTRIFPVTQQRG